MVYGQPATPHTGTTTTRMDDSSTEGVVDTIMSTSSHRVLGGKGTSKASKASKAGDTCAESSSLSCGAELNTDDALVVLEEDLDCTDFDSGDDSDPGITIRAPGVVFDCRGNKIIGGINTQVGIAVTGTDVVLKDCVISEWGSNGIFLDGATGAKLIRVSSTNNNVGLYLNDASDSASAEVFDSVFNNNEFDGVLVDGGSLFMADSEVSSNGDKGVRTRDVARTVTLVNVDTNENGQEGIKNDGDGVFRLHEVQSCENNSTFVDVDAGVNDIFNSVTCDTSDPDGVCACSCY